MVLQRIPRRDGTEELHLGHGRTGRVGPVGVPLPDGRHRRDLHQHPPRGRPVPRRRIPQHHRRRDCQLQPPNQGPGPRAGGRPTAADAARRVPHCTPGAGWRMFTPLDLPIWDYTSNYGIVDAWRNGDSVRLEFAGPGVDAPEGDGYVRAYANGPTGEDQRDRRSIVAAVLRRSPIFCWHSARGPRPIR